MHRPEEYSDERSSLLASENQSLESSNPHIVADDQKPSTSVTIFITIAIFGSLFNHFVLWLRLRMICIGVFLACADECFVTATYSTIASEFLRNSDGSWLLLAYNLGYCYALPMVSRPIIVINLEGSRLH